jgi:molybdopterin synthase catalytic subunit
MSRYLTHDPIDVGNLLAQVGGPGRGGTVLFLGSVRRGEEDGPVAAIEYSGYEEMAAAEFERIAAEVRDRWPDIACRAVHRIGNVPAGEPSIAVVAAAPHRREAFEACRFTIEEAKRRLPVWKRERFDDGTTRWRQE